MTRHGWGAFVITLGAWEAIAYTTRRLPTVTSTYARCRRRTRVATFAYVVWAAALYRHLHRYLEETA